MRDGARMTAPDTLQWAESELERSVSDATTRAAVYLERGYPRVAISRTGGDPWPYTVAAYDRAPATPRKETTDDVRN
jgi:hypothetical protein